MDEFTFQQELARVKSDVARMAATHRFSSHADQISSWGSDSFGDQLSDVKFSLQNLQTSLDRLMDLQPAQNPRQSSLHPGVPTRLSVQSLLTPEKVNLSPQPSDSGFLSTLSSDVAGLDTRMASLELNVSVLSNRLSQLESPHFKLTGSNDEASHCRATPKRQASISSSPALVEDPLLYPAQVNSWDEAFGIEHQAFANGQALEEGMSSPSLQWAPPTYSVPVPDNIVSGDLGPSMLSESMQRCQAQDHDRGSAIANLDMIFNEQASTIRIQQAVLEGKDSQMAVLQTQRRENEARLRDLNLGLYTAQQDNAQSKWQIQRMDRKVQQLHRIIREMHCREQDAVDRVTASKDEEIRVLRNAIEVKEALVSLNERVIAQSKELIEERDQEILRLGQELTLRKHDFDSEVKERTKIAKCLKQSEEEITQLRECLTQALIPSAGIGGWKPKAFKDSVQLPHEKRRASAWESGSSAASRPKFGVSDLPQGPSTLQEVTPGKTSVGLHKDSSHVPERPPVVPKKSLTGQVQAKADDKSKRHTLPLESLNSSLLLTPAEQSEIESDSLPAAYG